MWKVCLCEARRQAKIETLIDLDIFRLKGESLEDSENLPEPDVLAHEIVEKLESALEMFAGIEEGMGK